jgi:hypothetical protein
MRAGPRAATLILLVGIFLGASSASALAIEPPGWIVEEGMVEPGSTEATLVSTATTKLTSTVLGVSVEFTSASGNCQLSGGMLNGTTAEAPDTITGALKCTSMVVEKPANCSVSSPGQAAGTVLTNALKGTLVWLESTGGQAGILIKPSSGTELAKLVFSGSKCALAEVESPLKKEAIAKLTPVEEEVETATASLPGTPILNWWSNAETRSKETISQLTLGTSSATLESTLALKVPPGRKVADAKKRKTYLCKEAPGFPVRCGAGKMWTATVGTPLAITGADEPPAQTPAASFELRPAPITTITCPESHLSAETQETSGRPLLFKNFSLTFSVPTRCTTGGGVPCSKIEMTNKPVQGSLQFSLLAGQGSLEAPLEFRIKCGTGVNCRYKTVNKENHFRFAGAGVAAIKSEGVTALSEIAISEGMEVAAGCRPELGFFANYALTSPLGAWVEGTG